MAEVVSKLSPEEQARMTFSMLNPEPYDEEYRLESDRGQSACCEEESGN